eukprot:1886709-Prymnesium_polylepis.1
MSRPGSAGQLADILRLYERKQISMNKAGVLPPEANRARIQAMLEVDMHQRSSPRAKAKARREHQGAPM